MSWSDLAAQFSFEIAFGVLFALAFVPRAPVGAFFYRLLGSAAVFMVVLGLVLAGQRPSASEPAHFGAGLALASYPFIAGTPRGARWGVALALALAGCALAVARSVHQGIPELSTGALLLATASALATGTVAGSVGLAMVLGHWYLTIPNLEVSHLRRLNRVTVVAMLASIACLALSSRVFGEALSTAEPPLFGPMGLFYLGTRIAVGLGMPLVFAAMAASALRYRNTRSATGILYASTVLVLIGAGVSLFLQDSYRVPL